MGDCSVHSGTVYILLLALSLDSIEISLSSRQSIWTVVIILCTPIFASLLFAFSTIRKRSSIVSVSTDVDMGPGKKFAPESCKTS